jgi:hypothetical protein
MIELEEIEGTHKVLIGIFGGLQGGKRSAALKSALANIYQD